MLRNVVFPENAEEWPVLIDFDFCKKEGKCYLDGFNSDFKERHKGAQEGQVMKKEHDLYSLKVLTTKVLECTAADMKSVKSVVELKDLIHTKAWKLREGFVGEAAKASNSPARRNQVMNDRKEGMWVEIELACFIDLANLWHFLRGFFSHRLVLMRRKAKKRQLYEEDLHASA